MTHALDKLLRDIRGWSDYAIGEPQDVGLGALRRIIEAVRDYSASEEASQLTIKYFQIPMQVDIDDVQFIEPIRMQIPCAPACVQPCPYHMGPGA